MVARRAEKKKWKAKITVKKSKLLEPADIGLLARRMAELGPKRWLLEQLAIAFVEARKGKIKTYDEHAFEINWMENIVKLADAILERRYKPGASVTFVIHDPMVREIFAAPFRDRVVHHFLYNMQAGWWDRRFIYNSYSCRVGKGTLFGMKQAQKMMWQVTDGCAKKAMVLKMDIRGYFMSLPRKKLYEKVKLGLDQQFKGYRNDRAARQIYKICKFLWGQVLMDDPVGKARRRGRLSDWNPEILPLEKSLFCQPEGQGIVIGNLTSQLVSNIYLDALDRYVTYTLGYKYYGRYVDDFFIMVPERQYEKAKRDLEKIERFLKEELGLKLHPKKRYMQSVYKGMSFLGARVYPRCLYPSDRLQSKFKEKAYLLACGYGEVESVVSYLGIMVHLDGEKMIRRTFDALGWRC